MLTYAGRAVPWTRLGLATVLAVTLMELVRWDPWTLWPLEGCAVGLLAGASAWCFDEQAAAVVDAAPRGLAWRTLVRSPAVQLLALVWWGVVAHAGDALFDHALEIAVQGWAAILAGAAWASWRRAGGDPMPGLRVATVVVPVASAWALIRPLAGPLPVFPYAQGGEFGDWRASLEGWLVAGAVSLVLLALTLTDVRWWRRHA